MPVPIPKRFRSRTGFSTHNKTASSRLIETIAMGKTGTSQRKTNYRRGLIHDAAQGAVRWCFRMMFLVFWRVRVHGLAKFPESGPLLLLTNHQSNLDPMALGVVSPLPINYLAKRSLFKIWPVGWFLLWNDCIPIDRESNAIGGMKETLKRLKRREAVLVFPEGSRSRDGDLQPIKPGFCMLARKTKSTLLPMAIDGGWQAFPPGAFVLRPGNLQVVVGDPIEFSQYQSLTNDELCALVGKRTAALYAEAKRRHVNSQIIPSRKKSPPR